MPFNSIFSWIIKKRIGQIDLFKKYPAETQKEVLLKLLSQAKNTEWGKKYSYVSIQSYEEFRERVPLQNYEDIQPFIDRMMKGEQNLLWHSNIKWFAQSSGTTGVRSKLIPVSVDSLDECHYKGGKDLLGLYYHNYPKAKVYNGKHLIVGGSATINEFSRNSYYGDLSAIIIKNLPFWVELKRTPNKSIALMDDWESKIERMAIETSKEDVCIVAGVPSWTLVLMNRILEITGAENILEIWPNIELFMHGGVSFQPYRDQFSKLIPKEGMHYVETYNASEGFFGIQDTRDKNELLLMLDYGIFFEFIPMSEFNGVDSRAIPLEEVELNKNYAMVISTNGGLWRYIIGDTVRFTSKTPYRFVISGRTKQFINAFGEELIVDNAERAIAKACLGTNAKIKEYTVAPIYMENKEKGAHHWLIEFEKQPSSLEKFTVLLDEALKEENSDYDAKRSGDLSLSSPKIEVASTNTFHNWLKSKGKLGGQNKIPRLSNNRSYLEEILNSK